MESVKYADLSQRVETEIRRLENQISQDTHKEIYLVAYEKASQTQEVQND